MYNAVARVSSFPNGKLVTLPEESVEKKKSYLKTNHTCRSCWSMLWCVAARITPARQAQRAGSFGVRCCCCWMALLAGDADWPLIELDETHKNLLPTISFRQRFCAIERRRIASHSRETTHHQRRPTSHEMCVCCYVTGLCSGQIASSTRRLLLLFSHDMNDALCFTF